jgi:hypothetical protein
MAARPGEKSIGNAKGLISGSFMNSLLTRMR